MTKKSILSAYLNNTSSILAIGVIAGSTIASASMKVFQPLHQSDEDLSIGSGTIDIAAMFADPATSLINGERLHEVFGTEDSISDKLDAGETLIILMKAKSVIDGNTVDPATVTDGIIMMSAETAAKNYLDLDTVAGVDGTYVLIAVGKGKEVAALLLGIDVSKLITSISTGTLLDTGHHVGASTSLDDRVAAAPQTE